jgi:hypothetical protein
MNLGITEGYTQKFEHLFLNVQYMRYDLLDTDHWPYITHGNAPAIHTHLKSITPEVKNEQRS